MPLEPLSAEDMRRIEENCIGLGISKLQLMENAGKAVTERVRNLNKSTNPPFKKIVVVCGLGNNGGDGFVAARHLSNEFTIHVVLVGCEIAVKTEEAQKNWDALKHLDFSISLCQGPAIFSPHSPLKNLAWYDLLVDALLGTGQSGSIREPEQTVIQLINQSKIKKLSIDVPTGYQSETPINADYVVALHRLKTGTTAQNATICDIGIPLEAELYTGLGDVLLRRRATSHKGENGRVLIIGGGPYTGAPTLAAMAALRSGIDIATVASPKADIIAGFSPNLIVKAVGTEQITLKEVDVLTDLISQHDSVVLGPGLGADPETKKAVRKLISASDNLTLDADGLSALTSSEYEAGRIAITPHQREFADLTGEEIPSNRDERMAAVKQFSREWNVITLLKGPVDIISDGTKIRLNKTGNSGMTVGGTGDVLAGLVGAFSAQLDKLQAASTAAYVNGCAGDLAFARFGYSLLATDVIESIPEVLSKHS